MGWRSRANDVQVRREIWSCLTYSDNTAYMRPAMKMPRWAKGTVIMALLGWLGLTIVSYLSLPMFQTIGWFSRLVTTAASIPAVLWSFTAVMIYPGGNLHLKQGVPAVNAGTTGNAPAVDADQRTRTTPYDVGAYEF